MQTNILKQIFFDEHGHWDAFVKKHKRRIRSIVLKEVEKFRGCGDVKKGFTLFACPYCGDVKIIPHRCKGRFCTTCSVGETQEWSRIMANEAVQVNHRHITLSMDPNLWAIFQKHRQLLKPLMDEAAGMIEKWFREKQKRIPGIIVGLHTFGARLNFNPHIHMLVTMGGLDKNGEWKEYDYIPFVLLRKQWQTVVLKLIRQHLPEKEKKKIQHLLQKAYTKNAEGFYIHAPRQKGNVKVQLGYIGRYIRRPAISLRRIEKYDGENVTYWYIDKKDGRKKRETLTVEEFIGRIITHIPDEQFKTIRHYGIYARRIKGISKKLLLSFQRKVKRFLISLQRATRRSYQERIKDQLGKDPMVCNHCGCGYEYKGVVCLKDGLLTIKHALDQAAKACLGRMICHITGIESKKSQKEEKRINPRARQQNPIHDQLYLFSM